MLNFFSIIADKIDRNNDSKVTEEELKIWIEYTQKRYLLNDVEKQWRTHNLSGKENLTWDDYRKTVYGFSHGIILASSSFFFKRFSKLWFVGLKFGFGLLLRFEY